MKVKILYSFNSKQTYVISDVTYEIFNDYKKIYPI